MNPATTATAVAAAGSCQTPRQPLTVVEAHRVMQQHLRCSTDACPRRRAALTVLTRAGRYVLAAT